MVKLCYVAKNPVTFQIIASCTLCTFWALGIAPKTPSGGASLGIM